MSIEPVRPLDLGFEATCSLANMSSSCHPISTASPISDELGEVPAPLDSLVPVMIGCGGVGRSDESCLYTAATGLLMSLRS